jgi:hypothetical protein
MLFFSICQVFWRQVRAEGKKLKSSFFLGIFTERHLTSSLKKSKKEENIPEGDYVGYLLLFFYRNSLGDLKDTVVERTPFCLMSL